ncbi:hypothetical protein CLV63_12612 [Murinocardiopsis flavida]|uniref:Uncharacterized protein n=1 Tax=Murinocardiopsis flavida TaxID=645275 RepID=A0A2P8CWR5_9ACTN|nr:hypothetical protein [Murinocardiopsis flavida]PSK89376.1 hypothetical protein CLV63_12612 [Murinocardiopsis flavida]
MSVELAGVTAEHLGVMGVLVLGAWRSYLSSRQPTWEREIISRIMRVRLGRKGPRDPGDGDAGE